MPPQNPNVPPQNPSVYERLKSGLNYLKLSFFQRPETIDNLFAHAIYTLFEAFNSISTLLKSLVRIFGYMPFAILIRLIILIFYHEDRIYYCTYVILFFVTEIISIVTLNSWKFIIGNLIGLIILTFFRKHGLLNIVIDALADSWKFVINGNLLGIFFEEHKKSEDKREISHLIFVIHGIGQKDYPEEIKKNATNVQDNMDLIIRYYGRENKRSPLIIPIEWRSGLEEMLKNFQQGINSITPDTYISSTLKDSHGIADDVALYLSKIYKEKIIDHVVDCFNKEYEKCQKTFKFTENVKISILAHSLGSVITYDILTQREMKDDDNEVARLKFKVTNIFNIGSPLGYFIQTFTDKKDFAIEIKKRRFNLYNLYHPFDIIAKRLEPLFNDSYGEIRPEPAFACYVKQARTLNTYGIKLLGYFGNLSDEYYFCAADLKKEVDEEFQQLQERIDANDKIPKRMDYLIFPSKLELRPLLFIWQAFGNHTCYWNRKNVAHFILEKLEISENGTKCTKCKYCFGMRHCRWIMKVLLSSIQLFLLYNFAPVIGFLYQSSINWMVQKSVDITFNVLHFLTSWKYNDVQFFFFYYKDYFVDFMSFSIIAIYASSVYQSILSIIYDLLWHQNYFFFRSSRNRNETKIDILFRYLRDFATILILSLLFLIIYDEFAIFRYNSLLENKICYQDCDTNYMYYRNNFWNFYLKIVFYQLCVRVLLPNSCYPILAIINLIGFIFVIFLINYEKHQSTYLGILNSRKPKKCFFGWCW